MEIYSCPVHSHTVLYCTSISPECARVAWLKRADLLCSKWAESRARAHAPLELHAKSPVEIKRSNPSTPRECGLTDPETLPHSIARRPLYSYFRSPSHRGSHAREDQKEPGAISYLEYRAQPVRRFINCLQKSFPNCASSSYCTCTVYSDLPVGRSTRTAVSSRATVNVLARVVD